VARLPVFPRQLLGFTGVVHHQLSLGVDGVFPVGERELEQLRFRNGLSRAGLDTEVAVNAAQEVDLVDKPVALSWRNGGIGWVVRSAHIDATGRAHAGAELATNALLHAVLVAVEDVAAVDALRLGAFVLRVEVGDLRFRRLLTGDQKTLEKRNKSALAEEAH